MLPTCNHASTKITTAGYFLTQCALALFFGQLLRIFPRRTIFLIAVSLFEIGSLLCGVAPSMNVLILGRAVAGVGAAGLFVSIIAIISQIAPLEKRPKLLGAFGGVFGISCMFPALCSSATVDQYCSCDRTGSSLCTLFWSISIVALAHWRRFHHKRYVSTLP